MKGRNGFTLMELMIVIAIIMILTGAIVARITTGTEKAKYAKANGEVAEISAAIRAFYMDTGYWPYGGGWEYPTGDCGLISKDNIEYVANDQGQGFGAGATIDLVKAKWKGPYLEAMEWAKDPWGSWYYYIYYSSGGTYPAIYALCAGPDLLANGFNYETGKVDEGSDSIMLLVHRF